MTFRKDIRPRRDSNSQSSDSKSDALSIRPRGQWKLSLNIFIKYVSIAEKWLKQPKIYFRSFQMLNAHIAEKGRNADLNLVKRLTYNSQCGC